jgi:hypothetical protein
MGDPLEVDSGAETDPPDGLLEALFPEALSPPPPSQTAGI